MKKKLRVAISGLGRIGRTILKKNLNSDKFKITFLNDVNPDVKNLAYLINMTLLMAYSLTKHHMKVQI